MGWPVERKKRRFLKNMEVWKQETWRSEIVIRRVMRKVFHDNCQPEY